MFYFSSPLTLTAMNPAVPGSATVFTVDESRCTGIWNLLWIFRHFGNTITHNHFCSIPLLFVTSMAFLQIDTFWFLAEQSSSTFKFFQCLIPRIVDQRVIHLMKKIMTIFMIFRDEQEVGRQRILAMLQDDEDEINFDGFLPNVDKDPAFSFCNKQSEDISSSVYSGRPGPMWIFLEYFQLFFTDELFENIFAIGPTKTPAIKLLTIRWTTKQNGFGHLWWE